MVEEIKTVSVAFGVISMALVCDGIDVIGWLLKTEACWVLSASCCVR